MKKISVIGGAVADAKAASLAERVGKEIAKAGAVLICGGMGGIMEAASKGAKQAGGLVVGILPGTGALQANPYIDISIATGMGDGRNIIVSLSADAVIAIDGEFGTLSEIALALKNKRPVIGLNTWTLDKKFCRENNIIAAATPEEAVKKAMELEVSKVMR